MRRRMCRLSTIAMFGLMSSALMQSGACVARTIDERRAISDSLVTEVGRDGAADVLACLRAVEPQRMIEAQLAISPDSADLLGLEKLPFGPTAGCDVLDTVAP